MFCYTRFSQMGFWLYQKKKDFSDVEIIERES